MSSTATAQRRSSSTPKKPRRLVNGRSTNGTTKNTSKNTPKKSNPKRTSATKSSAKNKKRATGVEPAGKRARRASGGAKTTADEALHKDVSSVGTSAPKSTNPKPNGSGGVKPVEGKVALEEDKSKMQEKEEKEAGQSTAGEEDDVGLAKEEEDDEEATAATKPAVSPASRRSNLTPTHVRVPSAGASSRASREVSAISASPPAASEPPSAPGLGTVAESDRIAQVESPKVGSAPVRGLNDSTGSAGAVSPVPSPGVDGTVLELLEMLRTPVPEVAPGADDTNGAASPTRSGTPTVAVAEQMASEEALLSGFLTANAKVYSFRQDPALLELTRAIVTKRVLNKAWLQHARRSLLLRVLQALRVLTRDPQMLRVVYKGTPEAMAGVIELCTVLKDDMLSPVPVPLVEQAIGEIGNVLKRLAKYKNAQRRLLELGAQRLLFDLLSCRHKSVLQIALLVLHNLSDNEVFVKHMESVDEQVKLQWTDDADGHVALQAPDAVISPLLSLVRDGKKLIPVLAGSVLDVLLATSKYRRRVTALHGCKVLAQRLAYCAHRCSTSSGETLASAEACAIVIARCVTSLAVNHGASIELRKGGVLEPLLLILRMYDPTSDGSTPLAVKVCSALSQLALEGENAYQIRKLDGIHTLGLLICQGHQGSSEQTLQVQLHAFRTLRFLYSNERNRRAFKRLFPPDLFALFIDVGHYVHDVRAYVDVVTKFNAIPWSEKTSVIAAFEDLRSLRKNTVGKRVIKNYEVMEEIGEGAFGKVYQARKLSPGEIDTDVAGSSDGEAGNASTKFEQLYAIKELRVREQGVIADEEDELKNTAAELSKEVQIISTLRHPNIVHYYESFQIDNILYIVMELVEGSSLLEHLNALGGKGQFMPEETIWRLFLQLCRALSYMHVEKHVVHRDLHPSNVMIDKHGQLKIADFGLARQKKSTKSIMKSVVGTISYSCPEIIQHQVYSDKADIWSAGCILYQMAALKPPFGGANPLTVAQRVVSGSYDPIPSGYSPLMGSVIASTLVVDPEQRVSVLQLSSILAPLLMVELDRVSLSLHRTRAERDAAEAAVDKSNKKKAHNRDLVPPLGWGHLKPQPSSSVFMVETGSADTDNESCPSAT